MGGNINKKIEKDDRKNIKEIKKDNKINIFANAGASLIVQKYNARPVRYEGPGKISLSPLLIDINNFYSKWNYIFLIIINLYYL